MSSSEPQLHIANEVSSTPESKARLLQRFRGPVEKRDAEVVEYWRNASPEAHARAMIELAHYAEEMAAQTGLGKDQTERLPNIAELVTQRRA